MADEWKFRDGDKKRVVVVGAGIAGLTAAHELCERGYEVEIIEAEPNPNSSGTGCVIGGMARTSWAEIPTPPDQYPLADRAPLFTPIALDDGPTPYPEDKPAQLVATARTFLNNMRPGQLLAVTSVGPEHHRALDDLRALLEDKGVTPVWTSIVNTQALVVQLAVQNTRVPGEHGFRFFPSFYRHMFDTMKRIPIQEASTGASPFHSVDLTSDSSRTVFDALRSADDMELGLRGGRSFEIERRPVRSLEQIRELLRNVLERAGYRGADLYRFATRYLEYLTSSSERRRAEYEHISWSDFLGLDGNYSDYFVGHVNSGAQALVAMSSDKNDARTLGSIAMQLTLDQIQINQSGYTDATLRGPTSVALFAPWRAYLESQRVKLTCATLVGFEGDDLAVRPVFARQARGSTAYEEVSVVPADYYVIAIPVDKFQRLFASTGAPAIELHDRPLMSRDQLERSNLASLELDELDGRLQGISERDRNDLRKHLAFEVNAFDAQPDRGPFRYMCGIQFFFDADVKVFLGHSVGLDSLWGVSYISQAQYWQTRDRGESGSRGVLSAIFTRFEVPARGTQDATEKPAKDCSACEIADRVWQQICETWDAAANGPLPEPRYFYLDDNLRRVDGAWHNCTPYLVNHVGQWDDRGGARTADGDYTYPIQLGHTVFAGAFMRTKTRLNTMEAANESGRRAINAILEYDGMKCQRAPVYDFEDFEIPGLRAARDLDARIFARGGAHVMRHGAVEVALRAIPWDLVRLGLASDKERR